MESLEFKFREPTREELDKITKEMELFIKTGCVHDAYLKRVLGEQSIGIFLVPYE